MRRLIVAAAVACMVLGILTPAQAEDPPSPESVELTPMGAGATCTAQRGRPYMESLNNAAWVSSFFSVNCQPTAGYWTITEVNADLLHRQGTGDGLWGPYSNTHTLKSRNNAGGIYYLPSRDRCNTGGAMRFYQQQVEVEVAYHREPGGQTYRYEHTYLATATSKRPCGAHEP